MNRRTLLAGLAAALIAGPVGAQPVARIGVVTIGVGVSSPYLEELRQGLREHGYFEGKNLVIEYRFAQGRLDRLPPMVAELVKLKVNVIVTEGTPTAAAAQQATRTIPIVTAVVSDPVSAGFAASFARPGGNLTGLTISGAERVAKQLQLLRESVPSAGTVAVIYGARRNIELDLHEARETARALGLALKFFEVRTPQDFEATFEAVAAAQPSAMITIGHGMLLGNSKRIVEFASKHKLPAVYPDREFADAGGLMAYGPDLGSNFRRAAGYVARILKGAKPADLPVEQPRKYELAINMLAAKKIGLTIPTQVLFRADKTIN